VFWVLKGLPAWVTNVGVLYETVSGGGTGRGKSGKGACAPGGTVQERHLDWRKIFYGILKIGRYWRIGVCIAEWVGLLVQLRDELAEQYY